MHYTTSTHIHTSSTHAHNPGTQGEKRGIEPARAARTPELGSVLPKSPPIDCKTPTILKGQTVHRRLAYCDHKYCKRYSPTTRKRKKKSFQVGGIIYNYIFLTLIFLKPVLSAIFSLSRPSCLDDLSKCSTSIGSGVRRIV